LRNKKGIRLVQVNPMHTKRLKELSGNCRHHRAWPCPDRGDPRGAGGGTSQAHPGQRTNNCKSYAAV
jgi:hypothetical protein